MRSLRLILSTGLLAVLLAPLSGAPAASAEEWLNQYYANPAPERFTSAVLELSRSGYFDEQGRVPLAIGFFAAVFAQNPDRVDEWLAFSRVLPAHHQKLLVAALWYSGDARGPAALRAQSARSGSAVRAGVQEVLATAPSLAASTVESASSLNLQWGVFLATGDAAPVRTILAALGADAGGFGQDVRWSLAQQAARHDRVLSICRDELSRQPNAVQETLRAVINQAESARPRSSS